ncbi:MAG TPA: hypothetical protein VHJ83_01590 [Micromonosporaceae bacterium]|jgi:hypothetical protein|nr:hypothetical protein [Micromonosporaceae bacterium]
MEDIIGDAFLDYRDERRTEPSYRYIGLLPLTLLTSGSASVVVAQAWSGCEVPLKTRLQVFYLHFPALVVASAVVLLLAHLLAGLAAWPHSLVVAIAVLLVITVTWSYFALAGLPLRGELCPDIQPSWWPWLLPPLPGAAP